MTCTEIDTENCANDACFTGQRECQAYSCFIQGQCSGVAELTIQTINANECLDLCKTVDQCTWFSFNSDDSLCNLYQTCPTLDETCTSCVTGQKECKLKSFTKLLVAGGYDSDTKDFLDHVEVVNLDPLGAQCQDQPQFPTPFKWGTGGLFNGSTPIVCAPE